jgi:hypothetical protein
MKSERKSLFWKSSNENFIGQYKIDEKLCKDLIKFFNSRKNKIPGRIGEAKVDPKAKESLDYGMDGQDSMNHLFVREYFEQLSFCLNKYKKKYLYSDKDQGQYILEGANIQKYKPKQGFYTWHYENNGQDISGKRHLVFMTYLNTVKNGGTKFFYQNKITQAKIGNTVIWPSAWTHTHTGQISKTQTKYIITGWWRYV